MSWRLMRDLTRRGFVGGPAVSLASLGRPDLAAAQTAPVPAKPGRTVLFTNIRLFDGVSPAVRQGMGVLVEGNLIKAVDASNAAPPADAQVIDGGGRTLMPALIDAHWHSFLAPLPLLTLLTADVGYIYIAAAREATDADARLHHDPRCRRPDFRFEAGDRPGVDRGTEDLSVGGDDHADRGSFRFPPAARGSA
ncbi:MAG: amidohydrolase family protein [Acetobacteraceae bacterium]